MNENKSTPDDLRLLRKIYVDLLGNGFDPERPTGYIETEDGGAYCTPDNPLQRFEEARHCWVEFPPLTTDLNAINKLEQQTIQRLARKRKVFRERLENLCGDTVLHASARNRTLALSQALEILTDEAKSNTHS